ncbi:hypothetical protein PPERSA_05833 [Pseudocohnilembus persalinus]|uniref:Uncharacterized protein n=1 Tax=Pseudocohnilembus persalinus TaxID=266149 RepID=A0A0V0QGD7_PSEPJ|nr:hypothetical protein PPERSA_05833 [Pseudocohnilembus persalinus]|eukprot:KRX01247.1 hypothetical protein PPERSA_05833 [Pseudocohnilembus persalinus]
MYQNKQQSLNNTQKSFQTQAYKTGLSKKSTFQGTQTQQLLNYDTDEEEQNQIAQQQQIKQMEQDIFQKTLDLQKFEINNKNLKQQLNRQKEEQQIFIKNQNKLKEEYENKIEQLNQTNKGAFAKANKIERAKQIEVTSLQQQIEKLKIELKNTQQKADEKTQFFTGKDKAIKSMEARNKQAEQEITDLKLKIKDLELKIVLKNQELSKQNEKIQKMQDVFDLELEKLENEKLSFTKDEQKAKTLEFRATQLAHENEKLAKEIETRTSQLNFKIETWMDKAQHYKEELESEKNERKYLENNLRIVREEKDDFRIELTTMKQQIKDYDDLQAKLRSKERYIKELEEDVDNYKRTIRKNPNTLMMDYDATNTQELIFRLQNDVRVTQMEADTRRQEAETWRLKAIELEEKLQGQQHFGKERQNLEIQISEKDEIIRNYRDRLETAQKEIEILNRKIKQGQNFSFGAQNHMKPNYTTYGHIY